MPATDPVQDRVEVPEPPVMLVELNVHERLVELVVTAKVTVPAKRLTGATVIVEVPVALTRIAAGEAGTVEIVKSTMWKVTGAELWEAVPDPAVPVSETG